MHKFFVEPQNIMSGIAIIDGDDAKHIAKVLRLSSGDKININNCLGKEYIGEILNVSKTKIEVRLIEETNVNNESNLDVTLFQGFPKSSKMDLIVQKNTELGVNSIIPVVTERVVVKGTELQFKKVERYRKIAKEACKQCKRTLIPEICMPIDFDKLLEMVSEFDAVIVPYENEKNYGIKHFTKNFKNDIKKIAVIIGPEGGFTDEEIEKLKEKGSCIVSLGPRILRTETAGFVSVSLLMYEFGDLGGNL